MSQRLLILACSRRKCANPQLLAAISRYDGPNFRVLRRWQYETADTRSDLSIYVLSARFGLIDSSQPIPFYDQPLTTRQSPDYQVQVNKKLHALFARHHISDVFISAGKNYNLPLNRLGELIPTDARFITADGAPGRRAAMLREWLDTERPMPTLSYKSTPLPAGNIEFRMRGYEYSIHSQTISPFLKHRLKCDGSNASNFHSWFVAFEDKKLAPKWIVSQLTGLPVSAFNTDDARRVLAELGFCVEQQSLIN